MEHLRTIDGYTITREPGHVTLARPGEPAIVLRWQHATRQYQCTCPTAPICGHLAIYLAARITPAPPGFDGQMEPW